MKRILRLALPLCTCVALTACGGGEENPPDNPAEGAETPSRGDVSGDSSSSAPEIAPDGPILAFVRIEGAESLG